MFHEISFGGVKSKKNLGDWVHLNSHILEKTVVLRKKAILPEILGDNLTSTVHLTSKPEMSSQLRWQLNRHTDLYNLSYLVRKLNFVIAIKCKYFSWGNNGIVKNNHLPDITFPTTYKTTFVSAFSSSSVRISLWCHVDESETNKEGKQEGG